MSLNISHVVTTIKTKFEVEGLLNRFFEMKPYQVTGFSGLSCLNAQNAILLEFATPYEEFPTLYKAHVYRLLIIFSLYEESEFSPSLQQAIARLQYRDNIDRIVLWSTVEIAQDTLQSLKKIPADVIFIDIPLHEEIHKTKSVSFFIPIEGGDLTYSLTINIIAERLIKRLRKMFHLVLSEISAPIYDAHYAKAKIATHEAMEFEEEKLIRLIKRIKAIGRDKIAIDIGCGTGRHSFVLARHFETVYAYDFSTSMIFQANGVKREKDIRNLFFAVNDFEYEKLADEDQFYGQCDLILASFGMGSFIEDTASMLRQFYEWLKPGGYIFLSFYNANAITLNVAPLWRDTSLAAQIDKDNHSLQVNLTPKTQFNIFCKLFDEGVEGEINKIFNIESITTYPMIMALLPNSLLENEFAHLTFTAADKTLAEQGENGYYATIIASKATQEVSGYRNVTRLLAQFNATHEIIEHVPVLSMPEVQEAIGYFPNCMIKTILLHNRKTKEYIAILLPAEKRVDKSQIARMLEVSSYQIKFATEKEVLRLGFPVGGIAPFGFEEEEPVVKWVDAAILDYDCPWFYTGIGDNRKTLKIARSDFLAMIADYGAIAL
jgi:ubiquinone/menaquinone biosynthesis C-methylase UbiE